ncbi:pyridoxamine 5'-phosphate oxidase [Aquicoccus sp. SU-CL01552]|uniref:pyridoxamine 5'-phosphate oxidase n=1 Tax=Aquicoccus sp. SU-CL01552 TaxID=3127656 RepID=UPI00334005D8
MRNVWHEGERRMQAAFGVEEKLRTRGAAVLRDAMPDQHRDFFAGLRFVVLSALDNTGQPWPFLRTGRPGFLTSPDAKVLNIASRPMVSEPPDLCLGAGGKISVLGIELETRRRNRMNGTIDAASGDGLAVRVDQSFGNCPRYIHLRDGLRHVTTAADIDVQARRSQGKDFSAEDIAQIKTADMFFIASRAPRMGDDPRAGVDVNHRGGQPGFVKVLDDGTLIFPDYDGNKFFNTLGNILFDPRVTLLLSDFVTGDMLTIAGLAEVVLETGNQRALFGAERGVKVTPLRVLRARQALPLRYDRVEMSRDTPLPGAAANVPLR